MQKPSLKDKISQLMSTNPVIQIAMRYFTDAVGIRAAALAYYLLFSVFPLLILFSSIISRMNINLNSFTGILRTFLPSSIVSLISGYLYYVESDYNSTIMTFSLVFSIYFPWRAIKGLMYDIRSAFRQSNIKKPRFYLLRELFCTLIIPVAFTVSLMLIIIGKNVIEWVVGILPPDTVHLSNFMLNAWQYLRFVLAAAIMSLSLTLIYQMSLDHPKPFRRLFPGTVAALLFWILASLIFSNYVENFGNYSVVYGTLGAVIVLLLWLYLSGVVFIMGAEMNAVLLDEHEKKNTQTLDSSSGPEDQFNELK